MRQLISLSSLLGGKLVKGELPPWPPRRVWEVLQLTAVQSQRFPGSWRQGLSSQGHMSHRFWLQRGVSFSSGVGRGGNSITDQLQWRKERGILSWFMWRSLLIYVKAGFIVVYGKSNNDLHKTGSFSPSVWCKSKWKIRKEKEVLFPVCEGKNQWGYLQICGHLISWCSVDNRLQGPEAAVTGSEDIGHEVTLGGIWSNFLLCWLFSMSKKLV